MRLLHFFYSILFCIWFLFNFTLAAQVVTLQPTFPSANSNITIIFDASQGNRGLENVNTVYIHIGAVTAGPNSTTWSIVPFTWGTANPAALMTPLGNKRFSFTLNPQTLFNPPGNVTIHRLAMVFRNANGSLKGANEDGSDIFYTLTPPGTQALRILKPFTNPVFKNQNDTLFLRGESAQPANLRFEVNGNTIATANNTTQLTHNFNISGIGKQVVRFSIDGTTLKDSINIFSNPPLQVAALPPGIDDGINYISDTSVIVVLRAPNKQYMYAIGDFNNWEPRPEHFMRRTPDGLKWWVQINGLTPGVEYGFQYFVDGKLRVADPYTEIILDPFNDNTIPVFAYPNRKPYPVGKTTDEVGIIETGRPRYNFQVTNFQRPAKSDLVVYELLIRDFGAVKTFNNVRDSIPYLKKLGINCIEFMPLNEFEGNNSWGYNPSFHHALDKFYGRREAFCALVDECHKNGIAVVVDMVLNHAFDRSPLCRLYWNSAQSRPSADNPWLNETARHDFNVGHDFNYESEHTQYYFKRVIKHWLEAYNIDGFRFDLSKGFTQRNTLGNIGLWGQYDPFRVNLWKQFYDYQQSVSNNSYCILEHFADNSEERELANYGLMFWGNLSYSYGQNTMGFSNGADIAWGWHTTRNWNQPNLLTYMESHDEERLMYKNRVFGNQNANYSTRTLENSIERMKAAALMLFAIPGPKMIWQFGEQGYDFSINYPCTDPCNNTDNRTAPKPIRWDYLTNPLRMGLRDFYAAMASIKRVEPVFKTTNVSLFVGNTLLKRVILRHSTMDAVALANFGLGTLTFVNPEWPRTGMWYEFFTGDSLLVNASNQPLSMPPAGYALYTTKKLPPPNVYIDIVGVEGQIFGETDVQHGAFPNPFSKEVNIAFHINRPERVQLRVFNHMGQQVYSRNSEQVLQPGAHQWQWNAQNNTGKATPGVYIYRLSIGSSTYTGKLILE
jgi:1,4-alpha-glucan branching enzyme